MKQLTLKRERNGLFILTFYQDGYKVWEKLFLEVENALKYFVLHPEYGDSIKVEGNLYL